MGIRGLNSMIKKNSPECISYNNIEKYKNSIFAIDCSILLYKFRYASKTENAHLIGIINRIKFYMTYDILPVFIFDGVPPEAKNITLEKRQAAKYKLYLKLDDLKEIKPENDEHSAKIKEEIEKISNQLVSVKKHHIDETKELLNKSGIPYLSAPEDAEKYCAFLQKNNMVDYTVTDDTDAMTFGCEKIIKTNINKEIIEINFNKLLEDFKMNTKNFIDFCILSGCDYTDTISQIGPVTAYNIILKYNSIEEYLQAYPDKNNSNFNYKVAREIFTNFNYEIPLEKVSKKTYDKNILVDFLKTNQIKDNVIKKFLKIL